VFVVLIVFECMCELSVCEILDVCDVCVCMCLYIFVCVFVCVCVCVCVCVVAVVWFRFVGMGVGVLLSCFVSVLWFIALRWIAFYLFGYFLWRLCMFLFCGFVRFCAVRLDCGMCVCVFGGGVRF